MRHSPVNKNNDSDKHVYCNDTCKSIVKHWSTEKPMTHFNCGYKRRNIYALAYWNHQ